MLRNIDPLLTPDLLKILREMGHGDEIAIVDANYPAVTDGRRVVRLAGVDATEALRAILTVLPLDTYVDHAAHRMEVVGDPDRIEPITLEFQKLLDDLAVEDVKLGSIERFDFYARVKDAFAVVTTAERRLYGNIILKKGVIPPTRAGGSRPVFTSPAARPPPRPTSHPRRRSRPARRLEWCCTRTARPAPGSSEQT
jgi:L-fucose mutarotase